MKRFLSILIVLAGQGCAVYSPTLTSRITAPDGTVTEQSLRSKAYVVWPATSELGKQKASVGKTLGLGVDAVSQSGGGTNAVAALQAILGILNKLSP